MSWLLFIDESGIDRRTSPYEVLAGVAIRDADLWNIICAVHQAEWQHFGRRVTDGTLELKGKKLLKKKTFRHAAQGPALAPEVRARLAGDALDAGSSPTRAQLTALGQAKLAFVESVFEILARHRCRAFASVVPQDAPRSDAPGLRKDYSYLFQRFFYFVEDQGPDEQGILVFDELERSQAHVLVDQVQAYFKRTTTGRTRASRVVPEPFFVHSHLTLGVQFADLLAYVLCWGVRVHTMTLPARDELAELAAWVLKLRYRTTREIGGRADFGVWSFAVIDDLRPEFERVAADAGG